MVKIRAVLFDLDGVLIDAKSWHFIALNEALKKHGCPSITMDDHLTRFDGLPTRTKLSMLTEDGFVPQNLHEKIYKTKQESVHKQIKRKTKPNQVNINALYRLQNQGYILACCSNAIKDSVIMMLELAELLPFFSLILSNQDVEEAKPNPEMYLKAMEKLGVRPEECLIVEDNEKGFKAAIASGAKLMKVKSSKDVTYKKIKDSIEFNTNINNVVIPMAGDGSRFAKEGYRKPKPFIDVDGVPMIKRVIDGLRIPNRRLIFIIRDEQYDEYVEQLKDIIDDNSIILTANKTEGQASTVLHAHHLINNDDKLTIVNSDQLFFTKKFFHMFGDESGLLTFIDDSGSKKWSYAKVINGKVVSTREKIPISDYATIGLYYFTKGKNFVDAALDMIIKNDRAVHNGEFYVCPAFNYFIKRGGIIRNITLNDDEWCSIGTPELLRKYLRGKTK